MKASVECTNKTSILSIINDIEKNKSAVFSICMIQFDDLQVIVYSG